MTPARRLLRIALLALVLLYGAWFGRAADWAALAVFALPPVLLGLAALRGWHRAGFTSSMLALLWFSHGVMMLWSEPALRLFALAETVLALLIIHAACLPGMQARREQRRSPE